MPGVLKITSDYCRLLFFPLISQNRFGTLLGSKTLVDLGAKNWKVYMMKSVKKWMELETWKSAITAS